MANLFNVVGISGSTRENSINLVLLKIIVEMFSNKLNMDIYERIALLPQFNPDHDQENIESEVLRFRNLIESADGVIICTPEYAHGVPGTLKNAIDWTVSSSGFYQKPTVLITASTDGKFGHQALMETLLAIGCRNVEQLQMVISFVKTKVTAEGKITEADALDRLTAIINEFVAIMELSPETEQ
jgi:chromate reductase